MRYTCLAAAAAVLLCSSSVWAAPSEAGPSGKSVAAAVGAGASSFQGGRNAAPAAQEKGAEGVGTGEGSGLFEESGTDAQKEKVPSGKASAAKKTAPAASSGADRVATAAERVPIEAAPLEESDFRFSGISLGDPVEKVERLAGVSHRMIPGTLRTEYVWNGMTVTASNAFPFGYMNRADLDVAKTLVAPGISSFYISGKAAVTRRGVMVGDSREKVLRLYGRPDEILMDGRTRDWYITYTAGEKMLVFTVKDDAVSAIRCSWKEEPYALSPAAEERLAFERKRHPGRLDERDFSVAGYRMEEIFQEHPFDVWEKKMTNPDEEMWYFKGYALRMTLPEKRIDMMFLTDRHMVTPRGLARGDLASTAALLYGAPAEKKLDTTGPEPVESWFYLSGDSKKVLIIYVSEQKQTVSGIMMAENLAALEKEKAGKAEALKQGAGDKEEKQAKAVTQ